MIPTRDDIRAAYDRVRSHVRRTPVISPGAGSFGLDLDLACKLELLQHTGSFKPRGAFNKMLSSDVPAEGVLAASGGNFGLAVAYAAGRLGHAAEIFVPSTSPAAKIDRIRGLGATVRVVDGYFHEANEARVERAAETGALSMHPYDQPEVVAGQGTIGLELSDQTPETDTVLVAVGGGGLIGGIASWFAGDVTVVGVEPELSSCMDRALRAGAPVESPVGGVAADSLGPRQVGEIAFEVAERFVDRIVLVDDDSICAAQFAIWRELRLIAEPGGATALAALIAGAYVPARDERVVVLICGTNCDPDSVIDGSTP